MTAVGSLLFCADCGTLLDTSSADPKALLPCDVCGATNKNKSSKSVTTRSKPTAFPSALRARRSAVQTLTAADVQTDASIRQTCPNCGRGEMRYYTLQLRSADEGSTVFYNCVCGYKFSTNN